MQANPASNGDGEVFSFIRSDLEQIYEEHRAAEQMIHNMLKISLAILSLPILAFSAYLSSGLLRPDMTPATGNVVLMSTNLVPLAEPNLATVPVIAPSAAVTSHPARNPAFASFVVSMPGMLAITCILSALFNGVPIFSILENHLQETRCKHAINQFRLLYVALQKESANDLLKKWEPKLSRDSNHPIPMRFGSSAVITAAMLTFFSILYLAAGLESLTKHDSWSGFLHILSALVLIAWVIFDRIGKHYRPKPSVVAPVSIP